jgi:hypothetical protein
MKVLSGLPATMVLGAFMVVHGTPARSIEAERRQSYVQTAVIEAGINQGAIIGFCVPEGGGLVAVTGMNERYGARPRRGVAVQPPVHRVVWFDGDGVEARAVDLDFAATVVGAAPQGGVYVAGDGVVIQLSADGQEIARGATPQGVKTAEERAELEKSLAKKRDAQVEAYERRIEQLRTAIAELEETATKDSLQPDAEKQENVGSAGDEDAAESEYERRRREARLRMTKMQGSRLAVQLRQLEAQARAERQRAPAQLVEQLLHKSRQVRAISGCQDGVVLVVSEPSGYGYAAWRLDERLGNPKKVLSNLEGCCGQMDVQMIGGHLAVAANRKHRVDLCSFDGTPVATVGKRVRANDDGAGFGGCCNPMNICQAPDGCLLTSESDGVVKRFDVDGEFVEVVGKADVRGGCKNSAIAIEPDGSRLYYMDSAGGKVLVLTKGEDRGDIDADVAVNPEE